MLKALFIVAILIIPSFTFTFTFPSPSKSTLHSSRLFGEGDGKTLVVAGASGYIGKSTVKEAVRQGYKTISLVRSKSSVLSNPSVEPYLLNSEIVETDVTDLNKLKETMKSLGEIDTVISCLASRSGTKRDSYLIDYSATSNFLKASTECGARHFTLLSAFCCKNPWLQFQQAKLKFEEELEGQKDLTYSIVRPTAFFKSVSGQLEVIQKGAPFVMFGDGAVTRCNPIAEKDLATYLIECGREEGRMGRVLNLGGPDEPLTMKKQGEMLFKAVGKEENFFYAPLWLFDFIIDNLQRLADLTGLEAIENAAETGRIGKYYAVEDMLTTEPDEKFGTITLQQHYDKIAVEGQEYDPYTTMFAAPKKD
ncbi:hypothetical protein TrVE_jg7184 [Triparma verrucosa]|uniref:Divinyl chlorophyllide a 8-vinyl-reductase, chloroplastic n=1 Tax=Triparma verrucosa TaxID=1606542 RepID=A0A9W7C849_9STRA|nr:hypothetical protein TrVE_jg7184 [Triparma verrucosa]